MIRAIVGANWGDEGKGKITDLFAADADIVVRFQGGANAGHTIINDKGKFALHQLPSGVFYEHTTNVIGNGVALDVPKFFNEMRHLKDAGVTPKILISQRTQIVMPYHVLFDQYEEERLAGNQFGSTKSGIAPFYSDKYAKVGIQISDLYDEDRLREKLSGIMEVKNLLLKHLYGKDPLDLEETLATLMEYGRQLAPYVGDTFDFLYQAVQQDKTILLEGQLGSLKDPDFGIYPYTTSSHTVAGFGAIGAGIPPHEIKKITAVVKAYSSAVGAGPFVSEIFDEEAS
jgi:adenylosuccinate synthase